MLTENVENKLPMLYQMFLCFPHTNLLRVIRTTYQFLNRTLNNIKKKDAKRGFLGFAPLSDEGSLNAREHFELIEFVFSIFYKSLKTYAH